MSDYIFLFDLDATITKEEILPVISKKIGKFNEIKKITETTMRSIINTGNLNNGRNNRINSNNNNFNFKFIVKILIIIISISILSFLFLK